MGEAWAGGQQKRQPQRLPFGASAQTASYFMPYFWRNFSTRPAVSTIFCLPV